MNHPDILVAFWNIKEIRQVGHSACQDAVAKAHLVDLWPELRHLFRSGSTTRAHLSRNISFHHELQATGWSDPNARKEDWTPCSSPTTRRTKPGGVLVSQPRHLTEGRSDRKEVRPDRKQPGCVPFLFFPFGLFPFFHCFHSLFHFHSPSHPPAANTQWKPVERRRLAAERQ